MSTSKFFSINVHGTHGVAEECEQGMNKDTGLPAGPTRTVFMSVGERSIPNFSRVWGKRVVDKKTNKETGEIEFLEWGDTEGTIVEIRYHPSCPHIDRKWQDDNKYVLLDDDKEISLSVGINDFDVSKKALINMLEHHTFNKSNKSRDPENKFIEFETYNGSERVKNKTAIIERRSAAERYVLDAKGDEDNLAVLATMFELELRQQSEFLVEQLLEKVEINVERFHNVIERYREMALTEFNYAKENKVLEMSPERIITYRANEKDNPVSEEPFDGAIEDAIKSWVANITKHTNYSLYLSIQEANAAHKELVLD